MSFPNQVQNQLVGGGGGTIDPTTLLSGKEHENVQKNDKSVLVQYVKEKLYYSVKFFNDPKAKLSPFPNQKGNPPRIYNNFVKECKSRLQGCNMLLTDAQRNDYCLQLWLQAVDNRLIQDSLSLKHSGVYTVMQSRFNLLCKTCAETDAYMIAFECFEKRWDCPKAYHLFYEHFYKAAVGDKQWKEALETNREFGNPNTEAFALMVLKNNYHAWIAQARYEYDFETQYSLEKQRIPDSDGGVPPPDMPPSVLDVILKDMHYIQVECDEEDESGGENTGNSDDDDSSSCSDDDEPQDVGNGIAVVQKTKRIQKKRKRGHSHRPLTESEKRRRVDFTGDPERTRKQMFMIASKVQNGEITHGFQLYEGLRPVLTPQPTADKPNTVLKWVIVYPSDGEIYHCADKEHKMHLFTIQMSIEKEELEKNWEGIRQMQILGEKKSQEENNAGGGATDANSSTGEEMHVSRLSIVPGGGRPKGRRRSSNSNPSASMSPVSEVDKQMRQHIKDLKVFTKRGANRNRKQTSAGQKYFNAQRLRIEEARQSGTDKPFDELYRTFTRYFGAEIAGEDPDDDDDDFDEEDAWEGL